MKSSYIARIIDEEYRRKKMYELKKRVNCKNKEEHKDYLKKIKKKGDVYENNSISK